jgi:maltose O-acetyltransferase
MAPIDNCSDFKFSRKQRNRSVIKRIAKQLWFILLRLLDGVIPQYMPLYVNYIKSLGVIVTGQPKYIASDLQIDSSDYSAISIAKGVIISSEVRLLTHDYSVAKAFDESFGTIGRDVRRIAPINIEEFAFIGLRSTILPGVRIGRNAIVGACSVVTKDVEPGTVVAGNPARPICTIDDYCKKVASHYSLNKHLYFEE